MSFGGVVETKAPSGGVGNAKELSVGTLGTQRSAAGARGDDRQQSLASKAAINLTLRKETVFGVKGYVEGNVSYLSENQIVHPAGRNVAIYDAEHCETKFLDLADNAKGILAIAVSPNLKRIAVCEKREVLKRKVVAQVTIYSSFKMTAVSTLSFPEVSGFTSCS